MRRVVITGMGVVSPLGCGTEITWKRLLEGKSSVTRINSFAVDDLPAKIACQISPGDGSNGSFNADDWMSPKEQRKVDPFILYGMAAADLALNDADWHPEDEKDRNATGVLVGSGIGGLQGIDNASNMLRDLGPRKISPFFIPGRLINLVSGQISIRHGFGGPNHSVVTACSTGTHAIGDAAHLIMLGNANVMVAGGAESPLCRLSIAGFSACRALSTAYNDAPQSASRPFDRDRDGFVMGEGAGIIILEEYEHARARDAKIYAELIGYGLSGDAFHITSPPKDGSGALRCMVSALKNSGIEASQIDYINAHGTSTMADLIELSAVEQLLGKDATKVSMSSTKSAIGHLLGAAGAVEAIFSVLALRDQIAPPTLNLHNPEWETAIDLVPLEAREREINIVLSNSFGFGGANASIVLKKPDGQ